MKFLETVADLQNQHTIFFTILVIILTLLIGAGIQNIYMQTDFTKELPQDLDVIKLQNEVQDKFGGSDSILIIITLDKENFDEFSPKDIRDPKILELISELEESLDKENKVNSIQSVNLFFRALGIIPQNEESIKQVLNSNSQTTNFFNKDFTATMIVVSADLGNEEDISNFVKRLNEITNNIRKPNGVAITVTGSPPIQDKLMQLLQQDLVFTSLLTAIIIFLLILIYKKSITEAILIFTPLVFGLIWMLGTMGWLNIPLSITTVGVSAMILGLGTEYGVFLVERYHEERKNGIEMHLALKTALPSVGSGIIGSGLTTIAGFLALTFTTLPMIQNLGKILALGIICILIATIFVAPLFILIEEKIFRKILEEIRKEVSK